MKAVIQNLIVILALASVSACSSWVYRIDIPQGNFLEQKDIDKLRIAMTKEQVKYVLGSPVAKNAFDDDTWHYFYALKGGRGNDFEKQLIVEFKDDKLADIKGDFAKSDNFNTPLDI
ncbi:MAG: outer membrane protein assembly factor BamE [Gammaproteobacteria bacterium]|nr:outer membrane protein assembly factor BamE [Gammaproteobacteria bacterium]MBU2072122.1 outer membrane protein assembly factor BamE [Gammaproteobacteria bacterium]MBU2181598.1 outer membrane protein assembly factor BamE [Gammaproteobacteria bacterium]MBU2203453.1 outer membrane protein assembly factor BamE [Gammaproteobacteria bacterium]